MTNEYSPTWFETFLRPIDPAQTEREASFITRCLPQPAYGTLLDLCCGEGRHARLLAERGYQVTGVDRDAGAVTAARRQSDSRITYIQGDIRDLAGIPGSFDAAIIMWQSFGYFDDAANAEILRQINGRLHPRGRVILDLYHRDFFVQRQGVRTFDLPVMAVTETTRMEGRRLSVALEYRPGRAGDAFEWLLYTPEEISSLIEQCGFVPLVVCSGFDEELAPSAHTPRMQIVCEKRTASAPPG
ncbi:MAG: class I SAM-dependent methyltransferase [Chloroflexota bacterium]